MGRAAKLKQQRKQQRQNPPPLIPDPYAPISPSLFSIDPEIAKMIEWLIEQWSTVPEFTDHFTFKEAVVIAEDALNLLFSRYAEDPEHNLSLELELNTRFTIYLFLCLEPLSIETRVVDRHRNHIFEIT